MQSDSGAVFSTLLSLYFCRQFFILLSLPLQLPLFSLSLFLSFSMSLSFLLYRSDFYISLDNLLAVISVNTGLSENTRIRPKKKKKTFCQYLTVFPHWIRYNFYVFINRSRFILGGKKKKATNRGGGRESGVRATETKTGKGMKDCGE